MDEQITQTTEQTQKKKQKNPSERYVRVTFYHEGKQYSVWGKTPAEAHKKAAKKQLALENGEIATSGKMTVAQWATEWLETYKAPKVGEGQLGNYKTHINGVIIPAIGNKKLKDVKDIDLQKILNSRAGKSKSDIGKLTRTIKAIFKQARKSKLIAFDPAEDIEPPAAEDGTHRSITDTERKYILRLAETHYAGLWIKTILYAGLRPGETRALNWEHVDFKNKRIHIREAMKASTKRIGPPKSKAGERSIPMVDKLYQALKATYEASQCKPDDPVFRQPTTGRRHTKSSMQCLWGNFKRELDISMGATLFRNKIIKSKVADDLVPYCLRHTFGTDLQEAGVPLNVAKYLMGHSDIAVTANVYIHTTDDVIKDAANKMNRRSKKPLDKKGKKT